MAYTLSSSDQTILDQLLNAEIEFDAISLEQLPQDEVLHLLKVLRGHTLQLHSLVQELAEKMKAVEAFARPRSRRFYYGDNPGRLIN